MAKAHTPLNTDPRATATRVIEWDDSQMRTSYANVCNALSTREEVTLVFGTNQAWHADQDKVTVTLSNRLILSPYAAKRLNVLLTRLLETYEDRFGSLDIAAPPPTAAPAPNQVM